MSSPILVTGGAGFLGGWVVRELVERGDTVRALDLPGARWRTLPPGGLDIVHGDVCSRADVREALRGCRAVIHVAGLAQLWTHPRGRFSQANFHGAVNVLDEAVRAGCERIVHVSSATIWPLPGERLGRWDDAPGPYARSKWRAERHALRLARDGAPIVIVSPTAPIGPGDWSRTPPTQMLLDYCRGNHRAYLDMQLNLIDVRDAAAAMIAALNRGVAGRRYLLAGETVALLELFRRMSVVAGLPAPRRRVPYALALLAAVGMEWWADVISRRTPPTCVAGVQLTRRPQPQGGGADLHSLGVATRALDQTLAEIAAWFREVNWIEATTSLPRKA